MWEAGRLHEQNGTDSASYPNIAQEIAIAQNATFVGLRVTRHRWMSSRTKPISSQTKKTAW
jgi:hypothetical protein